MAALDQLGFGPCYHMVVILKNQDANEINTWYNLGQGNDIYSYIERVHE